LLSRRRSARSNILLLDLLGQEIRRAYLFEPVELRFQAKVDFF